MLYEKQPNRKVKCCLCARRCLISEGASGFCLVRKNEGGTLYSLNYGKVVSAGVDPISKKPLSHFHPGAIVMSIAAAGCNFRCQFCDNWMVSQDKDVAGRNFSPAVVPRLCEQSARPRIGTSMGLLTGGDLLIQDGKHVRQTGRHARR